MPWKRAVDRPPEAQPLGNHSTPKQRPFNSPPCDVYFALLPPRFRGRTLVFIGGDGNHMTTDQPISAAATARPSRLPRSALPPSPPVNDTPHIRAVSRATLRFPLWLTPHSRSFPLPYSPSTLPAFASPLRSALRPSAHPTSDISLPSIPHPPPLSPLP